MWKLLYFGFILVIWNSLEGVGCSKRTQTFTLYDDTGQTENYTGNVGDLESVSNLVKAQTLTSVCSQVGVWAFFASKNFTDHLAYGYHPATPDWTCNARRIGADHELAAVNSIRHLGNSDLDSSAISLYKLPYFASDELYFDGDIISLPIPSTFSSFGFTGKDSWTLFSLTNFSGEVVCLRRNLSEASGVTYNTEKTLHVGSIVKGCHRAPRLLQIGEVFRSEPGQNPRTIQTPKGVNLNDANGKHYHCIEFQDLLNASISVFSGNELRLPEPEPFDSFTIQKDSSWTIFQGSEFDGKAMCLKNLDGERNRSAEATNYKFMPGPFLIGSIRQGCLNDTDPSSIFDRQEQNPETPDPSDLRKGTTTTTETPSNSTIVPNVDGTMNNSEEAGDFTTWRTDYSTNVPRNSTSRYYSSEETDLYYHDGTTTSNTDSLEMTTDSESALSTRKGKNLYFEFTASTDEYDSSDNSSSSSGEGTTEITISAKGNSDLGQGSTIKPIRITATKSNSSTTSSAELEANNNSTDHDYHDHDPENKPEELVSSAGSGNLFFVAFLVVLGILIASMLITMAVFIYYRATRHRGESLPS